MLKTNSEADEGLQFVDTVIVDGLERFNVGPFPTVTKAVYWVDDWRSRYVGRNPNAAIQQGPQGIFASCWLRVENE